MIRPNLAHLPLFMLCGLCLCAPPASATEQSPDGSNAPVSRLAGPPKHYAAGKGHIKRAAHLGMRKHSLSSKGAIDPVRRSEDMTDAPVPLSDAKPAKPGAASEFTVTPHILLNFGAATRL